jgi:hypothetical protein
MIPDGPFYYVDADGQLCWPKTAAEIRALVNSGGLKPEANICTAGGQEWLSARALRPEPLAKAAQDANGLVEVKVPLSATISERPHITWQSVVPVAVAVVLIAALAGARWAITRPPLRQQTVFITDENADADLQRLADGSWEVISTRRAHMEGLRGMVQEWGYEFIIRGRAAGPFSATPTRRQTYRDAMLGLASMLKPGGEYVPMERMPLFVAHSDATEWPSVRRQWNGDGSFVDKVAQRGAVIVDRSQRLRMIRFAQLDEWGQVVEVEVVDGPNRGRKLFCEARLVPPVPEN